MNGCFMFSLVGVEHHYWQFWHKSTRETLPLSKAGKKWLSCKNGNWKKTHKTLFLSFHNFFHIFISGTEKTTKPVWWFIWHSQKSRTRKTSFNVILYLYDENTLTTPTIRVSEKNLFPLESLSAPVIIDILY